MTASRSPVRHGAHPMNRFVRHHADPWIAPFAAVSALEAALARGQTASRDTLAHIDRVLLHTVDAFALLLRPDGRVVGATPASLRATGWTHEDVAGRTLWSLPLWASNADEMAVREAVLAAADGRSVDVRATIAAPDAAERLTAALAARPIRDEAGQIAFVLVQQHRDRTPLRRPVDSEAAMAGQLQRLMELRQRLVADVGHDARAPLLNIAGRAERLLDHPDSRVRVQATEMRAAALELLEQVEELGDLSRMQHRRTQLHPAPVDLAARVRSIARQFEPSALRRQLNLVVEAPPELKTSLDEGKVTRILSNLLANAIRHARVGGTVRVTAVAGHDGVRLDVADSGAGIPPRERDRVFRRTYRGPGAGSHDRSGRGLGLAIVREAVEIHRGTIEIADAPEGGTLMRVWLPEVEGTDAGGRTLSDEASWRRTTELAVADLQRRLEDAGTSEGDLGAGAEAEPDGRRQLEPPDDPRTTADDARLEPMADE